VIGPGARKAVAVTNPQPRIAVIATEATVQSDAYAASIRQAADNAEIIQTACPLFVPLAEENWTQEAETFSIAAKYLNKIIEFAPEALVLGCTHYPILRDVIQQTVGARVKLIDSGEACAEEVEKLLNGKGLANPNRVSGERRLCDDLDHFYVTDAADRFARVAERFLGAMPAKLEAVELDELKRD
jgi:glutamate racemase